MNLNVTLLFFLLLIPLSGFIAWAGDRIGHKTGKRRHSLFGLRPRHTAMVFTIGSGMAIALVSFLLFFASSQTFRIVLRDGGELYATNVRLKRENGVQSRELVQASQRAADARDAAVRYSAERERAEAARDVAVRAMETAEKRQADAEARAKAARANYEKAVAHVSEARADLSRVKGSLATVRSDLRGSNDRLRTARARLQAANVRVREARKQVTTAEVEARDARAQKLTAIAAKQKAEDDARRALEKLRNTERVAQVALETQARNLANNLRERTAALQSKIDEQSKQYAELSEKTEAQKAELATLVAELGRKRAEYDQVLASTAALRGRQITYGVGEEVDRIAIRSGYNVWRIQVILDSFLSLAARKAEGRGAARGKQERAVLILPGPAGEPTAGHDAGSPKAATEAAATGEEDTLRAAANAIRRENRDMLVVAKAAANAVAGEPVAVTLEIRPNPVVLTADTKIGEVGVNGDGTRQEINDTLLAFLSRDVHARLLRAGMVPPSRGEGEAAGFSLSGEDWLEVMDRVRQAGSRARVHVYAARDMRAGDPVALRFEVKAPMFAPGVSVR